jgi:hypothetical protein
MKRLAAGAPPTDGAKRKTKRVLAVAVLKTIRFENFTGEVSIAGYSRGMVQLAIGHADEHCPNFIQQHFGWDVA